MAEAVQALQLRSGWPVPGLGAVAGPAVSADGKREVVGSAALDALIEYANGARLQADSEFCVGIAEFEASDREFEALVVALGRSQAP